MARPTLYTDRMIADYIAKGYWTETTLAGLWDRNAERWPDREALVDHRQRLTWAQAKRWIDNTALGLLSLGLRRDSMVVIQLPNWAEQPLLRVCCEKAGLLCCPVLRSLRESEMKYVLEYSEAEAIVIPWKFRGFDYLQMVRQLQPTLPRLKHVIVAGRPAPEGVLSLEELSRKTPDGFSPDYLDRTRFPATEFSQVLLTSGTTGVPKLVEFPICSRLYLGRAYVEATRLGPDDTIGVLSPAFVGPNSLAYFSAPEAGSGVVMLEHFEAETALQVIERERVTVIGVVPAQLAMMLAFPGLAKYDLGALRLAISTGSPLPFSVAMDAEEKLKAPLLNFYGSVDAGGSNVHTLESTREARHLTVGKPIAGVEIKLIDDEGSPAGPGGIGEVWLRGPTMVSGYYKDPAMNASAWTADGWFRTGDYGRWDSDGNLAIVGRKKDVIIRGGQNVYPAEIENLLFTHPRVKDVAVVGMPDPVMGERACAFVVPRGDEPLTFEEMTAFLQGKKIAAYKLPERLELVESLPMVAGGQKVNKKALSEAIAARLKAGPAEETARIRHCEYPSE
ncbi:MAG: acyl--CoA ligase [Chloroflexi bacterium]|nr:acyl--CoA ligase [Chloroflexota bacterium]